MCASTETDVRESASDCTFASGKGLGSGGETSHPMSLKRPCPHPGNALYYQIHVELVELKYCNLFLVLEGAVHLSGKKVFTPNAQSKHRKLTVWLVKLFPQRGTSVLMLGLNRTWSTSRMSHQSQLTKNYVALWDWDPSCKKYRHCKKWTVNMKPV
jgi:hypothetical protein